MQCMSSQVSINLNKGRLYFSYEDPCRDFADPSNSQAGLPIANVRAHKVPRVLKAMSQSNRIVAWVSSQAFRLIGTKEVMMNKTMVLVNLSSLEKNLKIDNEHMKKIKQAPKETCLNKIKIAFNGKFKCNTCSAQKDSCIKDPFYIPEKKTR